jgi:hypothetical protein
MIQEYDFKVVHIEGIKNVVADAFSRLIASTVIIPEVVLPWI